MFVLAHKDRFRDFSANIPKVFQPLDFCQCNFNPLDFAIMIHIQVPPYQAFNLICIISLVTYSRTKVINAHSCWFPSIYHRWHCTHIVILHNITPLNRHSFTDHHSCCTQMLSQVNVLISRIIIIIPHNVASVTAY